MTARTAGQPAAAPPPAAGGGRLRLPMVISGQRYTDGATQTIVTSAGCQISMPAFTAGARDALLAADRQLLRDLPIQSITTFLNRAGRNWRRPDYGRRRIYVQQLRQALGYSEPAAEHEADWIGVLLTSHARMLDLIELELGSRFVLDEWVRTDEAYLRAFPAGLVTHVLPGNVPSSTVISLIRALLTKNISMLKPAADDPVTAVSLALSLAEVEPGHPVARAVSAGYWPAGDQCGERVLAASDAVCAWGRAEAIAHARAAARPGAGFAGFGPKRSVALIGRDADLAAAATGLAHDISLYDQAACFSTQEIFAECDAGALAGELATALARYEDLLPPRHLDADAGAALNALRLQQIFEGGVERYRGRRASIIVAPFGAPATEAPLDRTVLIRPVADLADAVATLDSGVQTVAAAPWQLLRRYRDEIGARGVSRLVEVGLSNLLRIGATHDGYWPLQRLVRFAALEAPASEIPKGMVLPLDQTKILENRAFQDVVL